MSVDSALAQGRAAAAALLVDACEVLRPTGNDTVDPDSGASVPEYEPNPVYSGPCRLKMTASAATDRTAGQQMVSLTRVELQLPASADHLRENDRPRVTASRSPGLVGRVLRIDAPWLQTDSVMCRYACEESSLEDT